mgnify:FL=1
MAKPLNRGSKDRPNWYCHIKHPDGKWKWEPSKQPTSEAARRWGIARQAEIENIKVGILPRAVQKPALTVRQLIDRSIAEYHGPKIRKLKQNQNQRRTDLAQRIAPYGLADLHAEKVRAGDIERWRDALRKDSYAHSTINATLARLSMIFAWAIRQEIITCRNPCEGVNQLPTKPRQDCYTLDEVHRLLSLPDVLPMIPMVLYTGIRRGELLGLRWEDIDFQAERIDVRRSYDGPTKTDQTRVIPLHRELAPILRAWREQCPKTPEAVVFPLVVCGVARMATRSPEITTKELRAQLARAGVRNGFACPVHAMRHTFASLFMEQVDSQKVLESIMGHSTAGNKVTAGYIHTDVKTLARKLNQMTLKPQPEAQIIPLRATA